MSNMRKGEEGGGEGREKEVRKMGEREDEIRAVLIALSSKQHTGAPYLHNYPQERPS